MPYATRVSYVAVGGQRDFDVTFPYLDALHVEVSVSGALLSSAAYAWIGNNRIQLVASVAGGTIVSIRRRTPLDRALVQFRNGSVLAEDELNRANLQILYVQQELTDLYEYSLERSQVRLGNNLSVVTTPDQIMDDLAAIVLADELLADLVNRIADSGELAQLILSEALRGAELKRGVNVIQSRVTHTETTNAQQAAVLSLLAIVAPDGQSMVLREDKVYRSTGETYAQAFTQISTNFGTQSASITSLGTAQTTANTAMARLTTTLGAYSGDGLAFVLNQATVKVSGGGTLAETFNGITSRLTTAEAAVVTVDSAVATESSARASAITGVTARLGPLETSVTTLASADTALGAKWGVALNVNGHVSGIVLNNSGSSSDFNIVADKFRIVAPGGGTPITVFQTDGAYASFANPVTVTSAGAYKLIMGPAFGVTNNLILWYGPNSITPTTATKANALFALAIDGSMVFPATASLRASTSVGSVSGGRYGVGSASTGSVTASATGGTGSLSYSWVAGSGITANSPTSASTTFTGTLTFAGQDLDTFAICTITDSGSGLQTQIIVQVIISEYS